MRLELVKCVALGVILLSAGCASHTEPKPAAATADWRISLSATPAAPRQLDPTEFRVKIKDHTGKPVTGAQVTVQLAMPTMDMGKNEAAAQAETVGAYRATGRFTMPGDWLVTVQADKDAAHQTQSFPITVR